jgi:hypothetical protein
MNEIFVNIKKNLYELISAVFFVGLFYAKNKLVHDYFSYRGVFQSIRFKIFKIEKLSQLLVLSGADRSILYELIGDTFVPSAFSYAMELVFNMAKGLIRKMTFLIGLLPKIMYGRRLIIIYPYFD